MAIRQMVLTMMAAAMVFPATLAAQEDAGDIQEIKKSQDELRQEVQALRSTLNALDKKLDRVLSDLATVKKGQAPARPNRRQPDTTIYDVSIGSSPYLGPKDAPVTIVEFSDFQCPYCVREVPMLKKMVDAYPGKVKVVYKHYPLSFHKNAPPAQAAAILAQQQLGNEGFWKMHDLIVANPKKLDIPTLRQHAESLGLDLATFDAVMADQAKINALLVEDKKEAAKCKVRGTPTILINGLKLASRTEDAYKARIDECIKKAEAENKGTN